MSGSREQDNNNDNITNNIATFDGAVSCTYHKGSALSVQNLTLSHAAHGGGTSRILCSNASFAFQHGTITGLVGVNGAGKTSLALVLVSKQIPGFPLDLNITYVAASVEENETTLALNPIEYVQTKVDDRVASIRTKIVELENQLEETEDNEKIEQITEELTDLYDVEENLVSDVERSIQNSIEQVGLEPYLDKPLATLSCGWRYKCRLIASFITHPDILIVDEPSFLDSQSMTWFIEQMQTISAGGSSSSNTSNNTNGAMVVLISHKEALLETLCDRILYLNAGNQTITTYNSCRYSTFRESHELEVQRAETAVSDTTDKIHSANKSLNKIQTQLRKREKNLKSKTHENADERFIKGKNKEAKQKADKSAASKVKQLEKKSTEIEEMKLKAKREHVKPLRIEGMVIAGSTVISLSEVGIRYNDYDNDNDNSWIFRNVDASVEATDRILLTGSNGCGKSTLLKLIAGQIEQPSEGQVTRSTENFIYFPQTSLSDLLLYHGHECAKDFMGASNWTETRIRQHLGNYGLKSDLALRPIQTLSAGQRVRLWLAKELVQHDKPSLLMLDEISENVDIETRQSLVQMLDHFNGAVITVSHDPDFCSSFKYTQIWTLTPYGLHVQHA